MYNEPLKIKKRGEDGNRIITVRIKEETLAELDRIAAETNYSRNELINLILAHGIKNIEVTIQSTPNNTPTAPPRKAATMASKEETP
jgi:hypothetical protein